MWHDTTESPQFYSLQNKCWTADRDRQNTGWSSKSPFWTGPKWLKIFFRNTIKSLPTLFLCLGCWKIICHRKSWQHNLKPPTTYFTFLSWKFRPGYTVTRLHFTCPHTKSLSKSQWSTFRSWSRLFILRMLQSANVIINANHVLRMLANQQLYSVAIFTTRQPHVNR